MGQLFAVWQPISYAITMFTVYAAVWLFVRRMPLRSGLGWRVTVLVVWHVAIVGVLIGTMNTLGRTDGTAFGWASAGTLVTVGLFYAALPLLVMFLYECPAWDAVFCAAAGYTVQNFASSTVELVRALLGMPPNVGATPLETLASMAGCLVVYVLCDWLFINQAARVGLGHGTRRYAIPLLAVLVVVIFFDMLVKSVAESGSLADVALALRVAHVATCAFTLYAEYQMVYVGRLSSEVAAERSMREGEERIWELSRQNVAAINARVHDMRHQVARTLASSDAGIDRETLVQVTREISIYDTSVHTGNAALDTILSERGLVCSRDGIQLAVIADGAAVSAFEDADIFAIMGTLIDAASQAVSTVDDADRRRISLQVREAAGMAAIHVDCPVASGFVMPGLKDTRTIVRRLDGTLSATLENAVFSIDVLLPR